MKNIKITIDGQEREARLCSTNSDGSLNVQIEPLCRTVGSLRQGDLFEMPAFSGTIFRLHGCRLGGAIDATNLLTGEWISWESDTPVSRVLTREESEAFNLDLVRLIDRHRSARLQA